MANIAIIIDSIAGGGAEKVMLTLTNALLKQQHNVVIFSLKELVVYNLDNSIRVVFPLKGQSLRGWRKRHQQALEVKQSFKKLESEIGRFDLVLVNLFEAMKVAQVCNFPNSYYIIHRDIKSELSREWKLGPLKYFYMRKVLKQLQGKHLITVSKQLVDNIHASSLFTPASVNCIYNPIDLDEISALSKETLSEYPKNFILHVGRAAKAKRHDVLFQSLKYMQKDVVLVCLAERTRKLEKLAKKYNVSDKVVLPGFQQNPYAWMARAKAVVLSSDFEGLPTVLIEAIACHTRVVSTDCPTGPNEILTGDLAKYLVEMDNPKALGEAINNALKNDLVLNDADILKQVLPEQVSKQYLALIQ